MRPSHYRTFLILALCIAIAACDGEASAARTDWNAVHSQVTRLKDNGAYADAVAYIAPLAVAAEQELAGKPKELAKFHSLLGDVQREYRDTPAALNAYNRALVLQRKAYGARSETVAMTLNDIGQVRSDQGFGHGEEARKHFEQALDILESQREPDRENLALVLHNLAAAQYLLDDYAAARKNWERVLATRIEIFTEASGPVGATLYNLAVLTEVEGDPVAAEQFYRRTLAAYTGAKGDQHPDVADTLGAYADFLVTQQRHAEAAPLLERAVAIYERAYGRTHHVLLEPLEDLLEALETTGHDAEAAAVRTRIDEVEVIEEIEEMEEIEEIEEMEENNEIETD